MHTFAYALLYFLCGLLIDPPALRFLLNVHCPGSSPLTAVALLDKVAIYFGSAKFDWTLRSGDAETIGIPGLSFKIGQLHRIHDSHLYRTIAIALRAKSSPGRGIAYKACAVQLKLRSGAAKVL